MFLQRLKLKEDPFLDNIAAEDRPTLIRDFSATVQEQKLSKKGKNSLAQGTTKDAMYNVAEVFRENNRNNPMNDKDGKQDLQL